MNDERIQWLPVHFVNIPAVKAIADRAKQADEFQTLIDAQSAELIKLRAQVAELGVMVEELQAVLRERNEDVKRKDAQVAELQEWKDAVPVDALAFLVGATENMLGETWQSKAVVAWVRSLN